MKSYKFIFTILFALCCSFVFAQTTYKRVTIDRDGENNKVIVVRNDNGCTAEIRMEYKVGSRDSEWIYFDKWKPNKGNRIDPHKTERFNVGSKIYALKLTYVHLDCSKEIKEGIDAFVSGWEEGKKKKNDQ